MVPQIATSSFSNTPATTGAIAAGPNSGGTVFETTIVGVASGRDLYRMRFVEPQLTESGRVRIRDRMASRSVSIGVRRATILVTGGRIMPTSAAICSTTPVMPDTATSRFVTASTRLLLASSNSSRLLDTAPRNAACLSDRSWTWLLTPPIELWMFASA